MMIHSLGSETLNFWTRALHFVMVLSYKTREKWKGSCILKVVLTMWREVNFGFYSSWRLEDVDLEEARILNLILIWHKQYKQRKMDFASINQFHPITCGAQHFNILFFKALTTSNMQKNIPMYLCVTKPPRKNKMSETLSHVFLLANIP